MSETQSTPQARKAPKLKFATAAVVLAAVALVLVFAIKPFSGSDTAAAKSSSDDAYSLNFDGDAFSGKEATANTVKTEPVAQRDTEEKFASACKSCAKKHEIAMMPAASTTTHIAAGAASAESVKAAAKEQFSSGKGVELGSDGAAKPLIGNSAEIKAVNNVIAAGNAIKNYPYIWGGGHASFQANGYDCSGSVSYALKGANLVNAPMVSGDFMSYGQPGPGKWITIYSSPGHVFMFVGGLRFDTSYRDGPYGTRWQDGKRPLGGFAITHPVGL
jgi:cell wall-associated NlpC family hydrolase